MKHLGYQQVEVRVMQVKDYEHMLKLEINENENRKDFTRLERLEYARRLERIERVKAKKRMGQGSQNSDELGRTDDAVASKLGIGSRDTYRKEKYIAEHADKETLDAWDKGEISTHKAYTRIKELEKQVESLKLENKQLQEREPKVIEIEKEIERQVVPQELKDKLNSYQAQISTLEQQLRQQPDSEKLKQDIRELQRVNKKLEEEIERRADVKLESIKQVEFRKILRDLAREIAKALKDAEYAIDYIEEDELLSQSRRIIDDFEDAIKTVESWINTDRGVEFIEGNYTVR